MSEETAKMAGNKALTMMDSALSVDLINVHLVCVDTELVGSKRNCVYCPKIDKTLGANNE